jgi:hypothetical protein
VKRWVLVGVCAACGPGSRAELAPDATAPFVLPPGVWEPVPGVGHGAARVAVDDRGLLWWAYLDYKLISDDPDKPAYEARSWLTQTTSTGDAQIAPILVEPDRARSWEVASAGNIVALATPAVTKRYTTDGVEIDQGARSYDIGTTSHVSDYTALLASPDGRLRVASGTNGYGKPNGLLHVAYADIAADGSATAQQFMGVADDGWTSHVAIARKADDSVVLVWDRIYDQCSGPRPSAALATSVAAAPDPVGSIGDLPERGEEEPSVASSGDSIYVAWVVNAWGAGRTISVGRFPDATPLVTLGADSTFNEQPKLALAGPERGAVAWYSRDTDTFRVVSFEDVGGVFRVSAPHIVDFGLPGGGYEGIDGFVHVGGERYVLASTAGARPDQQRIVATELDLSGDSRQRLAPSDVTTAIEGRPARRSAFGLVPCIH